MFYGRHKGRPLQVDISLIKDKNFFIHITTIIYKFVENEVFGSLIEVAQFLHQIALQAVDKRLCIGGPFAIVGFFLYLRSGLG